MTTTPDANPYDVAELSRLANAFFASLPGGAVPAPPAAPAEVTPPASPDPVPPNAPSPAPLSFGAGGAAPGGAPAPGPTFGAPSPDPIAVSGTSLDELAALPTGLGSLPGLGTAGAAAPGGAPVPVAGAPVPAETDPVAAAGTSLADLAGLPAELGDLLGLVGAAPATTVTGLDPAGTSGLPEGYVLPTVPGASGYLPAAVPGEELAADAAAQAAAPAAPVADVPAPAGPAATPVTAPDAAPVAGYTPTTVAAPLPPAPTPAPEPAEVSHSSGLQSTTGLSVYEFSPEMLPSVPASTSARPFDPYAIRRDFPILNERVNGRPLIWLDNGATTHKPQSVIDRISHYYEHENSNIHRAAHTLAARSTDAYEGAREKVRRFLNAGKASEIVFVRGATEGINLVAKTWGAAHIGEGDEILVTNLEHHANIVPWQQLAQQVGATLKVAPVDDTGQIILSEYERLITPRTKLVALTQVSNALGTITPAAEMVEIARRKGAVTLVDAAQSVLHMPVDVAALDTDFLVFSGHKVFAPTGIGVVYGKEAIWADTPPWQGGGNMIADVTFERTVYQPPPNRFEAGTGNIADAVGLGAALDYVTSVGLHNVAAHEHELLLYGTAGLETIPGLRLIGTAANKAAVMSFVLEGHSPEDVGVALDREGIAVRAGHHCAQPILRRFGVEATVRPSLAMYNTHEDLDALVDALRRLTSGSYRGI